LSSKFRTSSSGGREFLSETNAIRVTVKPIEAAAVYPSPFDVRLVKFFSVFKNPKNSAIDSSVKEFNHTRIFQ
jgi:hypothetical protein